MQKLIKKGDDKMAKWADYGISHVRYNSKKTHIDQVKVYEDNGDKLVNPSAWTRTKVLQYLNAGKTFYYYNS